MFEVKYINIDFFKRADQRIRDFRLLQSPQLDRAIIGHLTTLFRIWLIISSTVMVR